MQFSVIKSLMLGCCVMASTLTFSQSNFRSPQIGMGVVVSDMERALDFYVNGIGMLKTGKFTIGGEFGKRGGLTGGDSVQVQILKLENSPQASDWKLMSFGRKAVHAKPKFIQDDTGVQYITIQVKSLKGIIERLKERKVAFLGSSPTPLNKDAHFLLVQDPDGTFVELIGPLD